MAISIYRSTDPNMPGYITNVAGSLATILDACLVNGYTGKSSLGWAITQTGTNLRTYRAPSGVGCRHEIAIDDTGTLSARLRVFQGGTTTAAGVAQANGTGPTPSDAQVSGGMYITKGSAAGRPWVLISNGRLVYLLTDYAGNGIYYPIVFGDFTTYKTSTDDFATIVMAGASANVLLLGYCHNPITVTTGNYIVQKYDGITNSVAVTIPALSTMCPHGNYSGYNGILKYPDPISGGLVMSPVGVCELYTSQAYPRGRLPGVWYLPYTNTDLSFASGDTFTGSTGTDIEGRTFEVFRTYINGSVNGLVVIETSDTWDDINFR